MKKVLGLILVVMMVTALFAGCGGGSSSDGGSDKTDSKTDSGKTDSGKTDSDTKDNAATENKGGGEVVIYQNKVEIGEALSNFAKLYTEKTGVKVTVKTAGGDTSYADALKAEFQTDKQPDLFVIEGMGGYNVWKDNIVPYEGDEWIDLTSLEFEVDGKVYGFPVAVEAWGMAYNVGILEKAGVDPATLTSQDGYRAAFEKIDSMKGELGLDCVVSIGAGPDLRWVTGLHNFNGYLSAGLPYGDRSVLEKLLAGEADEARLKEYVEWVELLFKYASKATLLTGNYDTQVSEFAVEKSAFIHQGNWIDPWLVENGVDFPMAFAPHASVAGEHNAIFIGAPSFYVINAKSTNMQGARDFLNFMATSEEGHNYMVNEAKMVPAFTNVTLSPSTPLSANVSEWLKKENGAYTWLQNDMPDGFGMGTIAPLYESFAKGDIDKETFLGQIKSAIEKLK